VLNVSMFLINMLVSGYCVSHNAPEVVLIYIFFNMLIVIFIYECTTSFVPRRASDLAMVACLFLME
jgi:hypothetical protein